MAIDYKQFSESVDTGIKATKSYTKFMFMYYNEEGKRKTKVVNYAKKKGWNKKDCIKQARKDYDKFTESVDTATGGNYTSDTKLNVIAEDYFKLDRKQTKWTEELKRIYTLYIEKGLGKQSVDKVTLNKINQLKVDLLDGTLSASKKTAAKGASNRQVNKIIVQCLIPVLKYAKDNGAIQNVPTFKKLEQDDKKEVTNAKEKIQVLYKEIMTRYADQPYYRAMFMLLFYGRRWGEVRDLHTGDIDWQKGTYNITVSKGASGKKRKQTFPLPVEVATSLQELTPDTGLVFASPKTGKAPWTPKKQLAKIKTAAGVEELTIHYFRHLLATAVMEEGGTAVAAAAMLGHTNTQTTERYYATLDTQKGAEKGLGQLEHIIDID